MKQISYHTPPGNVRGIERGSIVFFLEFYTKHKILFVFLFNKNTLKSNVLSAGCKGYRVCCMKNININYVTKMALQGTHLHRYNTATGMAEWKLIQAIIIYMNL